MSEEREDHTAFMQHRTGPPRKDESSQKSTDKDSEGGKMQSLYCCGKVLHLHD